MAHRRPDLPGKHPAVSGHTGSIPGSRLACAAGITWSGFGIVSRSPKASSRPDTTSRAPGTTAFGGGRPKYTSSMKPVPSPHVIRHGCRALSGASCRTTSTASVATWPGTAARMVGRLRRSM